MKFIIKELTSNKEATALLSNKSQLIIESYVEKEKSKNIQNTHTSKLRGHRELNSMELKKQTETEKKDLEKKNNYIETQQNLFSKQAEFNEDILKDQEKEAIINLPDDDLIINKPEITNEESQIIIKFNNLNK